MSAAYEPNPPSRRDEDFPKTNTIPDGWVSDVLMDVYNSQNPTRADGPTRAAETALPATGANSRGNGKSQADEAAAFPASESLFARRLEPFPTESDVNGQWL